MSDLKLDDIRKRFEMKDILEDSDLKEPDKVKQQDKFNVDNRLIIPKPGKAYRFRMLYFRDKESLRTSPFIAKFNHTFYSKNGMTDEWESQHVVCPTTEYLDFPNPWDTCKFCTEAGKLWKRLEQDKGNKKLRRTYNKMKRKFCLFIPVIVIENEEDPETVFEVKILLLSSRSNFNDINKIINSGNKPKYFNNLTTTDCFDLCVTATQVQSDNGEFSWKETRVLFEPAKQLLSKDWNDEKRDYFFSTKIFPLKFDQDYYEEFVEDEMDTLFDKFAIPQLASINDVESPPEQSNNAITKKELPVADEKIETSGTTLKPTTSEELVQSEIDEQTANLEKIINEEINDTPASTEKDSAGDTGIISTEEIDDILEEIQ